MYSSMRTILYTLILAVACTSEKDQNALTYTPFSQSVIHLKFEGRGNGFISYQCECANEHSKG